MHTFPNARLTPICRERLMRQHLIDARSLALLDIQAPGVGYQKAHVALDDALDCPTSKSCLIVRCQPD